MHKFTLLAATATVATSLSMYAFAAVPETPAKAPEVAAAAQSQVTTRDLLENIGLQVLINQLNEFRSKIVCPVGQESCDLRVHVEKGQIARVQPETGSTPVPAPVASVPHASVAPAIPHPSSLQSMPNHAPTPNYPNAPHHP